MIHFKEGVSNRIQSSRSDSLKYPKIICSKCNNERSQPWDKAYEQFEKYIFVNQQSIFKKLFIDLTDTFSEDGLLYGRPNLYKYFVKAFGCRLTHAGFPVPLDLVSLLFQEYFETKIRLCFSINKTMFAMHPQDRNNFLGVGDLIRLDSKSRGTMERFQWYINIGWLRVWLFYDVEIPPKVGASWTSDGACLYLGEFESATLDELIEENKGSSEQFMDHLLELKKTGGIQIC